jgi:hypothetical protein
MILKLMTLIMVLNCIPLAFAGEDLGSDIKCIGPYMMLPEVTKRYPEGSIVLTAKYDKLFKNHDVSLRIRGKVDLQAVSFISSNDKRTNTCFLSGNGIFIYIDCQNYQYLSAQIPSPEGHGYINLNCSL